MIRTFEFFSDNSEIYFEEKIGIKLKEIYVHEFLSRFSSVSLEYL